MLVVVLPLPPLMMEMVMMVGVMCLIVYVFVDIFSQARVWLVIQSSG